MEATEIQGKEKGVKAKKALPSQTFLGVFSGVKLPVTSNVEDDTDCTYDVKTHLIDARESTCIGRYLNDSMKPCLAKCRFAKWNMMDPISLFLLHQKKYRKNEELVIFMAKVIFGGGQKQKERVGNETDS